MQKYLHVLSSIFMCTQQLSGSLYVGPVLFGAPCLQVIVKREQRQSAFFFLLLFFQPVMFNLCRSLQGNYFFLSPVITWCSKAVKQWGRCPWKLLCLEGAWQVGSKNQPNNNLMFMAP